MKKIDFGQTVGILANVGVLVGIVVLIFEIRQNTLHTSTLLRDQIEARVAEGNAIYFDQNPAPIIEKSLRTPGELTFSEFRVVDAYLINGVNIWESERLLVNAGLLSEERWRSRIKSNAGWYFGNEYAKVWWERVGRTAFNDELTTVIDEAINEMTVNETYDYYLDSISTFQVE